MPSIALWPSSGCIFTSFPSVGASPAHGAPGEPTPSPAGPSPFWIRVPCCVQCPQDGICPLLSSLQDFSEILATSCDTESSLRQRTIKFPLPFPTLLSLTFWGSDGGSQMCCSQEGQTQCYCTRLPFVSRTCSFFLSHILHLWPLPPRKYELLLQDCTQLRFKQCCLILKVGMPQRLEISIWSCELGFCWGLY